MPFKPGASGNPGGRPRKSEQQIDFETKCRDWSSLYAFNKLRKHADHKEPRVFMWAITELLNRGFGKPVEVVEANVSGESVGISVEAIAAEVAQLIRSGEGEGGGASPADQVDEGK